jgi:hypothetical protein
MSRPLLLTLLVLAVAAWLPGDDADRQRPLQSQSLVNVGGEVLLKGKALAVTIKSDPTYGIYLSDARVIELGGRSFLVGQGLDSGAGEWTAGRRMWVSIDDISEIIEFETAEELRKTLEPEDDRPEA